MDDIQQSEDKEIEEATAEESAHSQVRNLDQCDTTYSSSQFRYGGNESQEHQTDPHPAQACFLGDNIAISGQLCPGEENDDETDEKF